VSGRGIAATKTASSKREKSKATSPSGTRTAWTALSASTWQPRRCECIARAHRCATSVLRSTRNGAVPHRDTRQRLHRPRRRNRARGWGTRAFTSSRHVRSCPFKSPHTTRRGSSLRRCRAGCSSRPTRAARKTHPGRNDWVLGRSETGGPSNPAGRQHHGSPAMPRPA
jgi:hypothetical protein